jgi:hypothetical protein
MADDRGSETHRLDGRAWRRRGSLRGRLGVLVAAAANEGRDHRKRREGSDERSLRAAMPRLP